MMWKLLFSSVFVVFETSAVKIVDVTFPSASDDFTFEGFLYLPSQATPDEDDSSRVPGVVLIHDSGPNSRVVPRTGQNAVDWGTAILVFEEIAFQLANQGIAVLTYDKRSCSRYNDCYNNSYPFLAPFDYTTVNVFLDDAKAAAKFLQYQEAINSEAVVVAGHGQSGQFLPSILLDNPTLSGGIMLSGLYRPIHELLDFQVQFRLDLLEDVYGLPLEAASEKFPELTTLIGLTDNVTHIASGDWNATQERLVGGIPVSFWQSWIDLADTALEDAAEISQPLLIINGDMDTNVPVSEAESWASYLDGLGASDRYTLEIFRCLSHAYNCIDVPDYSMPLDGSEISLFVDSRLPNAMATWVKQMKNTTSPSMLTETPESSSAGGKAELSTSCVGAVSVWAVVLGMSYIWHYL
jgi:alpha-beta hydrolase superfamily lysophospholipase